LREALRTRVGLACESAREPQEATIDALISTVVGAVAQNPGLATLVAFLAAIIEAVAVLGVVIPGTPILVAIAGAAGLAGMSMAPILVVAIVGAVIGDGVSYWLGARHGGRIRATWPLAARPGLVARAEAFFWRYGAPSVALARFVPVLRSTVPLVAGMAGMPVRRFALANVLSALVWAPLHVFPAQLAALSLARLFGAADGWTAWAAAGVLASALAAAWLLHRAAGGWGLAGENLR
jgi:undecaprenyl-diphosphatase